MSHVSLHLRLPLLFWSCLHFMLFFRFIVVTISTTFSAILFTRYASSFEKRAKSSEKSNEASFYSFYLVALTICFVRFYSLRFFVFVDFHRLTLWFWLLVQINWLLITCVCALVFFATLSLLFLLFAVFPEEFLVTFFFVLLNCIYGWPILIGACWPLKRLKIIEFVHSIGFVMIFLFYFSQFIPLYVKWWEFDSATQFDLLLIDFLSARREKAANDVINFLSGRDQEVIENQNM